MTTSRRAFSTLLEDGCWDADARAELDDVAEAIDARLGAVDEDVDTLGGLAFVLAGRVPQAGEILEHPSGWRLEVTDADARRVARLRLHAPEDDAAVESEIGARCRSGSYDFSIRLAPG